VRTLIFAQITIQRDEAAVFERLAISLKGSGIQHVIFTTYEQEKSLGSTAGVQNFKLS
jgi:hypothetical protein